jgi:hypothetical protein
MSPEAAAAAIKPAHSLSDAEDDTTRIAKVLTGKVDVDALVASHPDFFVSLAAVCLARLSRTVDQLTSPSPDADAASVATAVFALSQALFVLAAPVPAHQTGRCLPFPGKDGQCPERGHSVALARRVALLAALSVPIDANGALHPASVVIVPGGATAGQANHLSLLDVVARAAVGALSPLCTEEVGRTIVSCNAAVLLAAAHLSACGIRGPLLIAQPCIFGPVVEGLPRLLRAFAKPATAAIDRAGGFDALRVVDATPPSLSNTGTSTVYHILRVSGASSGLFQLLQAVHAAFVVVKIALESYPARAAEALNEPARVTALIRAISTALSYPKLILLPHKALSILRALPTALASTRPRRASAPNRGGSQQLPSSSSADALVPLIPDVVFAALQPSRKSMSTIRTVLFELDASSTTGVVPDAIATAVTRSHLVEICLAQLVGVCDPQLRVQAAKTLLALADHVSPATERVRGTIKAFFSDIDSSQAGPSLFKKSSGPEQLNSLEKAWKRLFATYSRKASSSSTNKAVTAFADELVGQWRTQHAPVLALAYRRGLAPVAAQLRDSGRPGDVCVPEFEAPIDNGALLASPSAKTTPLKASR